MRGIPIGGTVDGIEAEIRPPRARATRDGTERRIVAELEQYGEMSTGWIFDRVSEALDGATMRDVRRSLEDLAAAGIVAHIRALSPLEEGSSRKHEVSYWRLADGPEGGG